MFKYPAEDVFALFDKPRVRFNAATGFTGDEAAAKIERQPFKHAARPRREQYQFGGHKHRLFDIVGNQQHLLTGLVPQAEQQGLHLLAGKGIQRAKRFIKQQQLRVGRQRAGNAYPLTLAAGELPDKALFRPFEAHFFSICAAVARRCVLSTPASCSPSATLSCTLRHGSSPSC